MIAHLKGTVLYTSNSYLILEVNNIGYKVVSTPELLQSPQGSEIALYIYQKVTDSEINLFGLPDSQTLEFFEKLISVSGVGPKIALGIVSAGNISTLSGAIQNGDSAFFGKISGVGKKTAERIVVELKDKLAVLDTLMPQNDTFSALTGLGYSPSEVRSILSKLDQNTPLESQIKQALKLLK